MSIAGIPANNNLNLNQNVNFNQAQADFKALTDAVKAGDLEKAKPAYTALLLDFGIADANNQKLANTNIQALGNALQANDINAAKNIVTAMQQMQPAHHAHRGGHGGGRAKSLEAMLFGTTPQPGTQDPAQVAAANNTQKNDINFTA